MVVTSLGLILHHAFGCWHGDRRLAERHGKVCIPLTNSNSLFSWIVLSQAFEEIKARTSILPFQAILDGRQVLPQDYYQEWLRIPYLVILFFSVGTYLAHPLMIRAVYALGW